MDGLKLVSVGIPVYNEGKYINETIQSVLKQTYTNIEIIIADNCSTDTTSDIIQHFSELDSRIVFIRHKKNHGASFNFQYPVPLAKGEYFCWLGGHDLIQPNYIEQAVEVLESHPNISLVFPNSYYIDGEGNKMEGNPNSDIHNTSRSTVLRATQVLNNLSKCTAIHGVFHTKLAKQLPFEDTIGPDNLMLFYASLYGGIYGLEDELYLRREIRKETEIQRVKRYKEVGVFTANQDVALHTKLVWLHLVYTMKSPHISISEKYQIAMFILKKYRRNLGVPIKDIIKYMFS